MENATLAEGISNSACAIAAVYQKRRIIPKKGVLMDRTKILGASEVSVAIGINPFMSALKLWSIKTGKVEAENLDDVQAVEWGKRLERVVSAKFSDEHGVKLIARKTRYVHPQHEWLSCELDNIIAGTDELVEIKTVNYFSWKEWANPDELPSYVIVQVMMQLGLSKRKTGWVACLCGGQKYIEKKVVFDQEFYDDLVSKCVKFWKMVQDEVPPMAVLGDDDSILALHPKNNEELQSIEEMNSSIALLQETKAHIKELEDQQELLEVKLKEVIGDNLGVKTSKYLATWKAQNTSKVDSEAMKADGVYEKYVRRGTTRVLRIKLTEEKK